MVKIKIALDVDGVLLNFMQTVSHYIQENYNLVSKIPYATTQYSLYDRFSEEEIDKIDFNIIKETFEKAGYWKSLEPMPDSELIKDLMNNPLFDIYFVTSIPVHLYKERLQNLNTLVGLDIKEEKLICVPLGESKRPYIEKLKPDFFVEDNFKNLIDCHLEHVSIWIDLKENYYDTSKQEAYTIHTVTTFNEAVTQIKQNLIKKLDPNIIIKEMHEVFSDDLLTPLYKNMPRSSKTEGHCYAGAEALYHILGGAKTGLIPCVASSLEDGQKVTHWWLKDKNKNIIDPTSEQFYAIGKTPPYHLGKGSGFLTKYPSKRAKEIIKRMVGESKVPEIINKKRKIK